MVVVREQERAVCYRMRFIYIEGNRHVTGWPWPLESRSKNTQGRAHLHRRPLGFEPRPPLQSSLMAKPPSFLTAIFGEDTEIKEERPKVTLTFAQSLDAKIAGLGGKQLVLSGRESMVMTHW